MQGKRSKSQNNSGWTEVPNNENKAYRICQTGNCVSSGLRSGMTISFHHHLRNGDYVLNMVLEAIAELGIGDLTVNCKLTL